MVATRTAGTSGYSGEGLPALSSRLSAPTAIAAYGGGYLINSRLACRIMMLWPNATMTTAAGTGTCGLAGDGGLATTAQVNSGWGALSADPAGPGGGWVFADQSNHAVRRVSSDGVMITIAGTLGSSGATGEHWMV
jgi:hypothetical protein